MNPMNFVKFIHLFIYIFNLLLCNFFVFLYDIDLGVKDDGN